MNSKRKMQSGRTTAVIWGLTLLCYLGALVAAWQLDFIRYSRYSLEEALKQEFGRKTTLRELGRQAPDIQYNVMYNRIV